MNILKNRINVPVGARSVILNSLGALVIRGSGGAFGVISTWLISRLLGVESAGFYFFGFACLMIISVVSRFGFDKTVFRFVSQNAAKKQWGYVYGFMFQAFFTVFSLSLLAAFSLYFSSDFISNVAFGDKRASFVLQLMAMSLPMVSLSSIIGESLQALSRNFSSAFVLFVSPFLFMTIGLAFSPLYRMDITLSVVSYLILFSYAITFFIGMIMLIVFLPKFSALNLLSTQDILSSCFPLFLVDTMATLTAWLSQVYVGFYMLSVDVALLASAQRIAAMVSLLFSALIMITAPRLAMLYANGMHEDLKVFAQQAASFTILIAIPVIAGICLFSDFLMSLFGAEFYGGGAVLVVLSVGLFFNALNGFCSYLLVISGNEKTLRAAMMLGCLVAVILPNILIPMYGVVGAVFSVSLGWAIQCVSSIFFTKEIMGFNILDPMAIGNYFTRALKIKRG